MERIRGYYQTDSYQTIYTIILYLNLSDLRTTKKPPSKKQRLLRFINVNYYYSDITARFITNAPKAPIAPPELNLLFLNFFTASLYPSS